MKMNKLSKKNFFETGICMKFEITPWHHEAFDNYIYDVHLFNSEVQMTDKSYDVVLASMLNGCEVTLDAVNANELTLQSNQLYSELNSKCHDLLASKTSNANYMSDAKALMDHYHSMMNSLESKAHPTIVLVPNGFNSIEELQIWLDLQS